VEEIESRERGVIRDGIKHGKTTTREGKRSVSLWGLPKAFCAKRREELRTRVCIDGKKKSLRE